MTNRILTRRASTSAVAACLTLAVSFGSATVSHARDKARPGLASLAAAGAPHALLAGRLLVQVPETAAEPEGPTRSDVTRLVIDAGEERLELRATELFATAGEDLVEAARRVVAGWAGTPGGFEVAAATLPSGLRAAEVTPTQPRSDATGAFVRGLFVRSPDGTVQYLETRANARAARDFAAADALAARVLHSVSAGARRLPRGTAFRLTTPEPTITLFARAPEGVSAGVERERDRTVHRFQALAPLGENAPSLTLTFGKDGRYLHDRRNRELKASLAEGRLFGRKVLWHAWTAPGEDPDGGTRHLEALVTLGSATHPLTAHVLVLYRTDEQAAAMRALVESMVVERRPESS